MIEFAIKKIGLAFVTLCIQFGKELLAYALVNNEETYEPGAIFNFNYTGTVLDMVLFPGKYKLQCWGALGGSTNSYSGVGSTGGYSEGILTVTKSTTIYIFVGGKGEDNTNSTSVSNGGWNGGGGSVGKSSYNSDNTYGISYPACGGGATDIATATSSMSYSDYRTNRSGVSLLSRCIVAGGGAGASARYTEVTSTTNTQVTKTVYPTNSATGSTAISAFWSIPKNKDFIVFRNSYTNKYTNWQARVLDTSGNVLETSTSLPNSTSSYSFQAQSISFFVQIMYNNGGALSSSELMDSYATYVDIEPSTSTDTFSSKSNSSQQGGGTSGRGTSPGTQTDGGGEFGLGKNQTTTNYRYASGAGGGGWYGGGSSYSDSDTSNINYSGGGSGFVNIAANASSRPSGYTGLQLDSGFTKAGNVSFPSPNGGNETGHSGNGYVRITVLNPDGSDLGGGSTGGSASITWQTKSGTWNESSNSSAADSKQFTCLSPGSSGSTVLRCTFSGISSVKFKCRSQGESDYDYLTVGSIDTACTRSSYGTSLKGTSGTWKEITYTCDSGEHFVEFCYSKDGSVDTSPDNAEVYILEYT